MFTFVVRKERFNRPAAVNILINETQSLSTELDPVGQTEDTE
jgi:hypothetical protein